MGLNGARQVEIRLYSILPGGKVSSASYPGRSVARNGDMLTSDPIGVSLFQTLTLVVYPEEANAMFKQIRFAKAISFLIVVAVCFATGTPFLHGDAQAAQATPASSPPDDSTLKSDSFTALHALYAEQPKAKALGKKATAILVFPHIVKAGLVVGGQGGSGVLIEHGKVVGVYNLAAASFGLQAGAQAFSQVMFFETDSALQYLGKSDGWSIGTGPSVVLVDTGVAKSLTTDNLDSDVYVFIFGQHGLMAGLGIQGQKITRLRD
jgi:lipid-binding SYLF domain-containing protein